MSKSVTLRTSDAATGRKKKTKINSSAGARKNQAAVFASPGILRRFVLIDSPPFAPPASGCSGENDASPECHSRPRRARPMFDQRSSYRELLVHHVRRLSSRSAPTPEPEESGLRGRADRETLSHNDCSRAQCPSMIHAVRGDRRSIGRTGAGSRGEK